MNVGKYSFATLKWILFSYLVFLPYSYVALSYFNVDIFSSLIFLRNDGWCNIKENEGIGVHCFGDLNEGLVDLGAFSWSDVTNKQWYSPMDGLISKSSTLLGALIGAKASLLILLTLYFICVILPVKDFLIFMESRKFKFFGAIVYIGSLPIITAIDRMNSICLLIPIIYFFAKSIFFRNYAQSVLFFTLATLVKPQTLILLLLFPIVFSFTRFVICLIFSSSTFIFSLLVQFGFTFETITKYVSVIFSYTEREVTSSQSFNNFSFAHTLHYVMTRLKIDLLSENQIILIGYVFVCISIGFILLRSSDMPIIDKIQLLLLIVIFGSAPVVYGYYLSLIIVLELAKVYQSTESWMWNFDDNSKTHFKEHIWKILIFLIVLPIPIPILGAFKMDMLSPHDNWIMPILNPVLIGITIILYICVVIFPRKLTN